MSPVFESLMSQLEKNVGIVLVPMNFPPSLPPPSPPLRQISPFSIFGYTFGLHPCTQMYNTLNLFFAQSETVATVYIHLQPLATH